MKKYLIVTYLALGSASAMAFETPAQQSANAIKAVVQSILSDSGLQLLSITKVTASTSGAKAQLVNQNGECLAIPYLVKADSLGRVSVEVNRVALALCDE
jgi:hypothetical protein